MNEEPERDFFVSYNKADRNWAEWIAWTLEEAGYSTFIQAWDFGAGCNFVLEMHSATRHAERTILVLSPDYLTSDFTAPEWAAAFPDDPKGEKRKLIPARVRECKPDGLLKPIVYIDLVGLDEQAASKRLLEETKPGRHKLDAKPGFPGRPPRSVTSAPGFPGKLPEIWRVPPRNVDFTGRTQLLADLHSALTTSHIATLHGLGGIGKTQTAIEYAHRYAADYDIVWWVRAEQSVDLRSDLADLAVRMGLTKEDEANQEEAAQAARQHLEERGQWLLVFDNAPDRDVVKSYLPNGNRGHVILTSRDPSRDSRAKPLPVNAMLPEEAAEFLRKRTGKDEPEVTADLAKELGYLPLALEQASAYIETSGKSIADYLRLFRKQKSALLKRGRPSTDYPDTVATTWEVSFKEVESHSKPAAALLYLCSFLAPDDIPISMFRDHADVLPEPLATVAGDELELDSAVEHLQRYSLVNARDGLLSVHRLVQAVVQDRLPEEERKRWADAAVRIVDGAFPYKLNDPSTWPESALLLPHAMAATEHAEKLDAALDEVARLLSNAGLYMRERAEHAEARNALERALAIEERAYGSEHPDVATIAGNLGVVLRDLGDLQGARSAHERALAIDEKVHGPEHPTVAIRANNLGLVLRALGDLRGAKQLFVRAVAIDEKAYGLEHPEVATDVSNLGLVLHDLGDLRGAKQLLERALAIHHNVYGPEHPTVARDFNSLGLVLRDLGDLQGAEQLLERAVAIDERVYGPEHPTVAIRINSLGGVLHDQGDLQGAKKAYERALAVDEKVYGQEHPTVAIRVNNLGSMLQDAGDLRGAKKAYERALAIDEKVYGPEHPSVATRVNNLGRVLRDLGDLQGAKKASERALAIDEKVYGPEHPNVARDVNNLASVLRDLGDLQGAKKASERALAILVKFLPENHPNITTVRENLALAESELREASANADDD